ncbi:MAG TPA: fumarylacetoacetase [Pyrinomonadaceae bacterium]|nr:fumarylacetoacetase [Pyrinomonadaceae bacterium]
MLFFEIDETHDPSLESWLDSANDPQTDFPVQNLPLCSFAPKLDSEWPRSGLVIGDRVFDLAAGNEAGLFGDLFRDYETDDFVDATIPFGFLDWDARRKFRSRLVELFTTKATAGDIRTVKENLYPANEVVFYLPVEIGDYTDFYCSIFHATNVGSMFRPDNPLMPNYKWLPVGYHGRASSIVISGTNIRRPFGQNRSDQNAPPVFIPSRNLDYEVELGVIIGNGNDLGEPIPLANTHQHILGMCLVNDWSARDIQAWEYQPLGPFLAKNFATTVSPFIVMPEALAPFRCAAFQRAEDDPQPLPHLYDSGDLKTGGFDITLEAFLLSEKMRQAEMPPFRLSRSSTKDLYWTVGQMIAHHTSNGCNLQPGDLIATGTVSGPGKDERGCLLELTWRGTEPILLPTGEERRFLEDGDEVIIRGFCQREGFRRIGFGECRGRILPADAG